MRQDVSVPGDINFQSPQDFFVRYLFLRVFFVDFIHLYFFHLWLFCVYLLIYLILRNDTVTQRQGKIQG